MIETARYLIFVGEKYEARGGTNDLLMITNDYQSDFLNFVTVVSGVYGDSYIFLVKDCLKIYNQYLVFKDHVRFSWFEIFDLKTKEEVELVFWKPAKK